MCRAVDSPRLKLGGAHFRAQKRETKREREREREGKSERERERERDVEISLAVLPGARRVRNNSFLPV